MYDESSSPYIIKSKPELNMALNYEQQRLSIYYIRKCVRFEDEEIHFWIWVSLLNCLELNTFTCVSKDMVFVALYKSKSFQLW